MSYPVPTPEQIAFFDEHGYLVVRDAIPQADLDELETRCERLIEEKERLANDWAWDGPVTIGGLSGGGFGDAQPRVTMRMPRMRPPLYGTPLMTASGLC